MFCYHPPVKFNYPLLPIDWRFRRSCFQNATMFSGFFPPPFFCRKSKRLLINCIVDKRLGIKSKSYCTLLFQIPSDIRDRKVKTTGPQTERRIDSTYINSNWWLSRTIGSTYINSKLVPISKPRRQKPFYSSF